MSEFNKLHDHLRECVDNDDNTGVTEDGVGFNTFEWAFGLSVKAKKEHDQLVGTIAEKEKVIGELGRYLRHIHDYMLVKNKSYRGGDLSAEVGKLLSALKEQKYERRFKQIIDAEKCK